MSDSLIKAAVRACVTLSNAIESICEDEQLSQNLIISDLRFELNESFSALTDQLSTELKLDARKLVRDLIVADLESARAMLRAMLRAMTVVSC
jgi:hypothetical protein